MRNFFKTLFIRFFAWFDLCPVRSTSRDDVIAFFKKLHPRTFDKGLIRVGPERDGGYVLPNDLHGIEACFSPGVDLESEFELRCAEMGMDIFMADASVLGPTVGHEKFNFRKKFIGSTTGEGFLTLDKWVEESLPASKGDLLLQIDIEGFEYETFFSASDELMARFRIIVVEFHGLDQIWNRPFYSLVSRSFDKILKTHTCVHAHPNNYIKPIVRDGLTVPPLIEYTFIRNDRNVGRGYQTELPHRLDADNVPGDSVYLPSFMSGSNF